jgi:hypothetical protein
MIKPCTERNGTVQNAKIPNQIGLFKQRVEQSNEQLATIILKKSNQTTPKKTEISQTKVQFHDINLKTKKEPIESDDELLNEIRDQVPTKPLHISRFRFTSLSKTEISLKFRKTRYALQL